VARINHKRLTMNVSSRLLIHRLALLLLPAAMLALATEALGQAGRAQRPNVVLIMTDDVGYGDIGVYGAPDVKTPHIDGLARAGVRLTDFYANGATCTPTRAGLMTGSYQQRFGLEAPLGAGGAADRERGLAPTGHSLPQLLKRNGYATALVGKWHLGWKEEFSPVVHGFDYFFGFKSGFTDYYRHTSIDGRPDLFENDRPVTVEGYMTDLITQRSVRFIEQNARRPFFIDVAYNAAHWPYQVPGKPSTARDNGRHLSPFDDSTSTRADYIAMLERADWGVGRILRALDSLGLRQNTIVIFTNDNGGEWLSRNAPLFHHKSTVWEGGIRVPAIIRWPGRIPAGKVSHQVGITMDLTRSILVATGTPIPAAANLEGVDLFPALEGRAEETTRTLFWRTLGPRGQQAVRSGDWKLIVDGRVMLFNLRTDQGERENLIGRHPEVAKRLRSLLAAWQANMDAESKRAAGEPGSGREP
jgi:arylsulfatase A-like enzyme